DFTIVSRMPGGKESGVALDAISRGVPVIVSDHDPELTRKLDRQPWARVFRGGDPEALARALDTAVAEPPTSPPPDAAAGVGMLEAERMIEAFDEAVRSLVHLDSAADGALKRRTRGIVGSRDQGGSG